MAKKKQQTNVIILWLNSHDSECLNSLAYNGGNGPLRVYPKNEYDTRCGVDLPFFDDAVLALEYMRQNPGKQIQFDASRASRFGYSKSELAEV